jgi:hypothetical protein
LLFLLTRQERDRRQSFDVTYSILHSQDGTVVYVNRFQEPVFFGPNEVTEAIRRNAELAPDRFKHFWR